MKKSVLILIVIVLVFFLIPEIGRGVNGLMERCHSSRSLDLKKDDVQWLSNIECLPFHADRIFVRNLPLIRFHFNGIIVTIEPSWFSSLFGGQQMDYHTLQLDTNLTSKDKKLIRNLSKLMNKRRMFLIEKQDNGSVLCGLKRQNSKLLLMAPGNDDSKFFYIHTYVPVTQQVKIDTVLFLQKINDFYIKKLQ